MSGCAVNPEIQLIKTASSIRLSSAVAIFGHFRTKPLLFDGIPQILLIVYRALRYYVRFCVDMAISRLGQDREHAVRPVGSPLCDLGTARQPLRGEWSCCGLASNGTISSSNGMMGVPNIARSLSMIWGHATPPPDWVVLTRPSDSRKS
jgi:hypothetical protein